VAANLVRKRTRLATMTILELTRRLRGLSQARLAHLIGTSHDKFGRIERGLRLVPAHDPLRGAIAGVLQIPAECLFDEKGSALEVTAPSTAPGRQGAA